MQAEHGRDIESGSRGAIAAAEHVVAQAKLKIGAVDDPLETEADAVADRVMRVPDTPLVQRKCAPCDDEDAEGVVRRKPAFASIASLGTTEQGPGESGDMVSSSLGGGGSPLPTPARSFMESRFDADFSDVRIHADEQAASTAKQLHAKAFTIGSDIYFNFGQYSPDSPNGRHLLAHELTHVIQQGTTRQPSIQRQIEGCSDLLATPSVTTLISGRAVQPSSSCSPMTRRLPVSRMTCWSRSSAPSSGSRCAWRSRVE